MVGKGNTYDIVIHPGEGRGAEELKVEGSEPFRGGHSVVGGQQIGAMEPVATTCILGGKFPPNIAVIHSRP